MKIFRKPSQVPNALKTIDVEAILRKRGIYLEQRINQEMKQAAIPLARQMLKRKSKAKVPEPQKYAYFSNEEAMAFWERQIHVVEVIEKRFELKVQQFINKMVHGYLAHLESEIKSKGYFDDNGDELLTQAQLDFTPLLMDQAILAGQEAYKLIGSNDVYTPYKLRQVIADNVTKFTKSMIDTDRQKLIDIINNGIEEGLSVPEIRGMIQADFDSYSKMQAERITRTEVLRASNEATIDAYQQSGVVEGKQWLTAGADDECADYEGEIEALDGNFYDDTTDFADGDPPLHPNCRCVLLPVLIDEQKGYIPQPNKELYHRIKELEDQVDKRTKAFKEIKEKAADDKAYIKSLEKHLGVADD